MKRITAKLVRGTFGAMVLGALSFGAVEAFASRMSGGTVSDDYCVGPGGYQACYAHCVALYGEGVQSSCVPDPEKVWPYHCECYP